MVPLDPGYRIQVVTFSESPDNFLHRQTASMPTSLVLLLPIIAQYLELRYHSLIVQGSACFVISTHLSHHFVHSFV